MKSIRSVDLQCTKFNRIDYEDYIDAKMQEDRKGRFERHILTCDGCIQGLKRAVGLDKQGEKIVPQVELDYFLKGLRCRLDELYPQDARMLLAASDADTAAWGPGKAHGLAVDREGKNGFVIKCVATVGSEEVEKGTLEVNAEQVQRLIQNGTVYELTPPCRYVANKLKALFKDNALFYPFRLSRRHIHVDLQVLAGEANFTEAKSLTLTTIVAILSALTGQICDRGLAFSSQVEPDGVLFPKVGNLVPKLQAAKEHGIREVILSTANQGDCPAQFSKDKDFTLRFFSHIGEVLHHLKLFPEETTKPRDLTPAPWDSGPRSPSWKSLVGIGLKKGIPREVIIQLIDAMEDLCQMRNEMRPISTVLVVGDTDRIGALLPDAEIRLMPTRKSRHLEGYLHKLAPIVDGELTGFVLDRYGNFRSIRKVNIALQGDFKLNPLLSEPATRFALISAVTEALIFVLDPGGNRVQAFSDGELVCRYYNGCWQNYDLNSLHRKLMEVAENKGYDLKVLERLGRAAVRLSYLHLGGLLVVLPEGTSCENKIEDRLKRMGIGMSPRSLSDLSDEELIKFAKEDGAVLMDAKGIVHTFMAYLKPTTTIPVEPDPGEGARHLSARRFTAEMGCFALVISEDGAITAYVDNNRVYRL